MPANSPSQTSFTLRLGVDELLYLGITAGGAQATFGVPPQMSNYRGMMAIQIVPQSGTITSIIGQLEVSLIPESTVQGVAQPSAFGILNRLVPVSGSPAGLSPYSGVAFEATTNNPVVIFDISGLGGSGKFRLNFPTFTLGTASAVNVYAHLG